MTTPEYRINVATIEDLQMTNDRSGLMKIFTRSKSMVIQGGIVLISRESADGKIEIFDRITTEEDLETYQQSVLKYVTEE